MLDLDLIRRNPELVRQALRTRGEESVLEPILELDSQRRLRVHEGDELRARRNEVSREIGHGGERKPTLIQEMRQVGERIKTLEEEAKALEEQLAALLLTLPNIPREDVPVGPDSSGNVVVRTWGEPRAFDFEPKAHWDLNETLGIIDFERGAKL